MNRKNILIIDYLPVMQLFILEGTQRFINNLDKIKDYESTSLS